MKSEYDAIIIGGGHNGLTTAGYLARAGLDVLVLERRDEVGGPCSVVEYFPGYTAAITNSPGSLEPRIIADLELEKHGLRWYRPDPSMVMPFSDDRIFVAWRERERVRKELEKFSAKDVDGYGHVFAFFEDFARRIGVSLFEPPPTIREVANRLERPEDELAFSKIFFGNLRDLLDEYLESEELKALIGMVGIMSNSVGPSVPGSAYFLMHRPMSLVSYEDTGTNDPRRQVLRGSTGLPYGGMGSITQAMRKFIEANSGDVVTNAEVTGLICRDGYVKGVVLSNGNEYRAPVVVSNLSPAITYLDLLPQEVIAPELREMIELKNWEGNAFKVGLALDELPRFSAASSAEEAELYAACQFRISPSLDYLEAAYDDAKAGRPSSGPIIWGLTPSVADPSLTPEGRHIMTLSVFHAPYTLANGDWSTERDRYAQVIIDKVAEYIPNLKDSITDVRAWSPKDIETEFGIYKGNITHGDILPSNHFSLRPIPGWSDYRSPLRGMYLCSVGTWPGGNVSGIPGHNAARQILNDLALGLDHVDLSGRPGSLDNYPMSQRN